MALLVPNVGEAELLKRMLNFSAADNCVLKLFTNDVTPAEGDTVATYTEADFAGYAAATLTGASWSVAGDPTEASYAQQTFTRSSTGTAQSCYGYFVTNLAGTILLWAERFTDGPYTVTNNGDNIKVTPRIQLA